LLIDLIISSNLGSAGFSLADLKTPSPDLILLLISKFLSPLFNLSTSIRWFDRGNLDHPNYQLLSRLQRNCKLLCGLVGGELEGRKGIPFGQFDKFKGDICLLPILLISSCLKFPTTKADLNTR